MKDERTFLGFYIQPCWFQCVTANAISLNVIVNIVLVLSMNLVLKVFEVFMILEYQCFFFLYLNT